MDLPFKNMYDTFKDEIWKDLGPLDPDWFEALTAQTLSNDGNASDHDDQCAKQDGNFKTSSGKTALDSQLFSTPKAFRRSRVVSPETPEDEHSFTSEQEKEILPWTAAQTPYLFRMSKEGDQGAKYGGIQHQSQDSFDLLRTPQKSPVSYAKHISESLGAQIHPDISWTSSLNTPPAIPSTLILTKPDESPGPASLPADKNVVFVRKLFPSLSNSCRVGEVSPKNNEMPTCQQGVFSPAPGQHTESFNSTQSSPKQSDCVWRQKLPDAIEDGEIRSTVASVLDGAEDVLSIFFTSSSSALRKVKTDRIKRKQIISTTEHSCEADRLPSTPTVKTGEVGNTQWSPLSLSEIPPCTVEPSCHNSPATQVENSILTGRPQHGSDSGQQLKSCLKITDSVFSKKKRKFIYTVDTLKLQTRGEDTHSQKVDSLSGIPDADHKGNVKQLAKALDDTNCCIRKTEMGKEGIPTEENLLPSLQAKVQDLDISQLSKDFAQDFSQMPDPGRLCKAAGDNPQNGFSPSACLSAMKQANQKASRANLHHDSTDISNQRSPSTANQSNLIYEGTVSDSGFQSAAEDVSHVTTTSFVLPSSENNGQQQSQRCTGFQTHIYRTPHFSSTHKGNGKAHSNGILQEAETDVTLEETQTLCPSREHELPLKSTSTQLRSSAKGAVDNLNCSQHSVHGSLPEQTTVSLPSVQASGFKTASNKSMQISLANLERARRLFDITEGEKPCARVTKDELMSHGSVENTAFYSNQAISSNVKCLDNSCQLTASQKADVTELCTILEEADSQFEFTQFRASKQKQHSEDNATSPRKDDKELDPDFLTGINFDDSFNAENHLAVNKSRALFADIEENLVPIEKSSDKQSGKIGAKCRVSGHNDNFVRKEEDGGRLTCSDKQVSGLIDEDDMKVSKNSKMDTTKWQNGFQMASGKGISIPAKAMQEAEAFFKGCDILDTNSDMSTKYEKSTKPLYGSVSQTFQKCKNAQEVKVNFCEEPVNECENVTLRPAVHHAEDPQNNIESPSVGVKNIPSLTSTASFHGNPSSAAQPLSSLSCTKSQNIGSSSIHELSSGGGFCTASGQKVLLSAEAVRKAECLLNDIHTLKDSNKQPKQNGDALRSAHLVSLVPVSNPKNGGFQTASGKGVAVSSAALKKAKSLLSECDEDDDNISVKPTHSKMPLPGQPPSNGGFLAASGKPVAFSSDALRKAKALFSDISFSAEIPGVSDTRNNDKKQANGENTEKIHGGFTTAGGAKVHVSQKNLLKAKKLLEEFDDGSISVRAMQESDAFFKDCDFLDGKDGMLLKHRKCIAPLGGSGSDNVNLTEFKEDQKVTNIPEDSGSGQTELKNVTLGQTVNTEKMLHPDDMEIFNKVSKNTLDFTKAASFNGSTTSMGTSSLLGTALKNVGCSSVSGLNNGGGFCTASGKKVSVSDEAMTKAKSLLNENDAFEDTNKQLKQVINTLPTRNGGFQTASGKGVAISSEALKKAKSLLSECEGVQEKLCVKPTHSKTPLPPPPSKNGGFLAASGKPVAFSSDALQKAKALFSDISFGAEIPGVSDTRNKKQGGGEHMAKIHGGFTTAGGAKVHVSQKNLLKAKRLLKDFADGECHDSDSNSISPHTNAHKSDLSEVKDVKRNSNSNFSTATDKDHPEKSDPRLVKSVTSLQATDHENEALQHSSIRGNALIKDEAERNITRSRVGNLHHSPQEEMLSVSSSEGLRVKGTEETSVLSFQSLNLTGCTETQQMFLAQEALECTKALLEDEHLAGQSLSVPLENMALQENPKSSDGSAEEQKGKGKRPVDDSDMTAQPPLKRRLLEEFDRTVDSPRGSTLHSVKSSPNGAMKDRRVFRYSISLHPNITRPHRNGENYVETRLQKTTSPQQSTPGDSSSACSRMPTFVPPFLKNAKAESHKNTVFKDNLRTPSAFVPPFKKQRTIAQETSSKAQEEDKRCHLFVTAFNSNSCVSPTGKTQSTTAATENKIEDDIQTFVMVDTANDNLMNNQNQCLTYDSEDSAAEASGVEDNVPRSQDMFQNLHNVELARDMQDMRIRKKKRQTIRPLPGSLYLTKTSGVSRISLNTAVNGKPPARYTQKQLYSYGVHRHAYEITSETAESFRFSLQLFIKQEVFIDRGGVQLADGGWLIPSNDGTAGKEEFYRSLCDTPGVDPKLISEEWVYNHYRWIVWKQASMERSFPKTMGRLCLTPEQVLLQLKYRYDVEVDHSRRPALRKIMEKDDTAAKTLVLCVCGVVSRGQSPKRHSFSDTRTPAADAKVENLSAVVWLTDGWYAIKAQLDEPLTAMLHRGRLAVGGKMIIHGAQLVGSQDACSPLEAPESLMLKICANSSRLARWDSKLGFYRDPRPFLLPVSSLYSNGGQVGCVDIIILRSYPIQWMERKPDGGVVFRSVRAEEKEARRYASQKQKAMEVLFAKIQAEFEKEEKANNKPQRRRRTVSRQDFASLQDGEELYDAAGDDPAYFEIHLSVQQLETLRAYRRSLMEKKQAELQDRYRRALESAEDREGSCPKRDVTPVWRLCVADSTDQPGSVYQLNLWRPPSDLQSFLKEGCRYKVYNLTTSDGKKHGGSTAVQLTGTKKTQFKDLQASQEWLSTRFQPRVSTHFMDLQDPEFQPVCGEVDLTGCVITIIDGQGFSPAFYLADGKLNFVKVRCFSSLAQSGLEDVVKPRVMLALSNLQLRGQSTSPIPVVYAGDLTVFSTNPKEVHLQESLSQLRNIVQGQENIFLTAEEKLSQLIKSDGLSSISSPAPQTPTVTRDTRQDAKTNVTSQPPVKSFGPFTPVSRDPPAARCPTEKDPSSLKRRRALDYLSRIPSPPPLSFGGSLASPCVNKTFIPPRRSGTPSTLKTVQTTARKPAVSLVEDEWVNDEELAMIDTQALLVGDLV